MYFLPLPAIEPTINRSPGPKSSHSTDCSLKIFVLVLNVYCIIIISQACMDPSKKR
jgi:hypothetical protein